MNVCSTEVGTDTLVFPDWRQVLNLPESGLSLHLCDSGSLSWEGEASAVNTIVTPGSDLRQKVGER